MCVFFFVGGGGGGGVLIQTVAFSISCLPEPSDNILHINYIEVTIMLVSLSASSRSYLISVTLSIAYSETI